MSKSAKKKKKKKVVTKKKEEKLTFKDVLLALFFIFSFIFFLVSFATAVMPINDGFVAYPILVGVVSGFIIGFLLNKFVYRDSTIFFMILFAIILSMLFTAITLSFNRPLDRSSVKHRIVEITNKFTMGAGDGKEYYLEVKDFPKKRIQVKKDVYNDVNVGGKVDILVKEGFFHFPYIEDIIPVGINLKNLDKIPNVGVKKKEESK